MVCHVCLATKSANIQTIVYTLQGYLAPKPIECQSSGVSYMRAYVHAHTKPVILVSFLPQHIAYLHRGTCVHAPTVSHEDMNLLVAKAAKYLISLICQKKQY